MESTAWSVESREALAAVAASVAALAALTGPGPDLSDPSGIDPSRDADPRRDDPLRDLADACLDGLAEVARLEARTAAAKASARRGVRAGGHGVGAAGGVPAGTHCPGDGRGGRGRVCPDRERTLRRCLPVRLPDLDDGAAADFGSPAVRDDLVAARPDHGRRNRRPGPGRGGRAGGALPGPRRTGPRPRVPGRRAGAGPVPRQGAHLAGTPPPGQHRDTPHQVCRGPAGRVRPGPGRHGLAQRLPPGRHRRRDLGTDHRRRPRNAGPGRGPDPDPAPRRHRLDLAPHRQPDDRAPGPPVGTDSRVASPTAESRAGPGSPVRAGVCRRRGRRSWSPSQ